MKLSTDQVKKVAKLASLPISLEEEEKYASQLSKIIDYVNQLGQVKVANVKPTYNVTGTNNITREDVSGPSLSQEEALKNGSNTKEGYFVTKGVFDNE